MKTTLRQQSGISMLLLLAILAIAGFFMLCAFKLVPSYAENRYVVTGLRTLAPNADALRSMSNNEIRSSLRRYYGLNNVRSEGPQNIEVRRVAGQQVLVTVDYEVRTNLFYNIDVVLSFENHLHSAHFDRCCRPIDND